MICRNIQSIDIPILERLNKQQDFKIADIDNCIVDRIVLDENANIPIAYGIVKNFAEGILLVNPEVPKITRTKALVKLMEVAIDGSAKAGMQQLHFFVSDRKIAELFKKHYGFIEAKDIVLVKNL